MDKNYKYYKAIDWNSIEDEIDKSTWEKLTEQFWLDTRVPLSNDLDDWRKLSPAEKDLIGKVFGGLTLLDTMQSESGVEVLRKDVRTQHEEAVLGNIQFMECYTKGHQLLTYDGFKDISEITEDDFVLAYNKDTNTTRFEKVVKTSSHKADKIYHFHNKHFFDLKVSPGHRMLIEEKTVKESKCNDWYSSVYTAEELYKKKFTSNYQFLLNREFEIKGNKLTPLERFFIAYQADGSHREREKIKFTRLTNEEDYADKCKSTDLYGTIGFVKERKIKRFESILKELKEIDYNLLSSSDKKGGKNWAVKIPYEYFSKNKEFKDWFNLESFDSDKAKDFISELAKWDSFEYQAENDNGYISYYTKNENNKDFVEQVATLAGYIFTTTKDKKKNADFEWFAVRIRRNQNNLKFTTVEKEVLDSEIVYGVEVPSSYLVVKTKDGLVISGNCVHAKSYSSIFSTLNTKKEIEDIFEWTNNNEYLQKKAKIINEIYERGSALEKKVASVFLESFLFYSGFFTPLYYLGNNKMANVAEIIKLIIRDESVHGTYIGYKFQLGFNELPEEEQTKLRDWLYELLFELYENEEKYTEMLYDELGWTEEVKTFLRYNANKALMNLGQDPLFPDSSEDVNPIVMNGISTGTSNHDFFSQVGNGYLLGQAEAMKDSDYDI